MERSSHALRAHAEQCRDLSASSITPTARDILAELADEYDKSAGERESWEVRRKLRPAFAWPVIAQ